MARGERMVLNAALLLLGLSALVNVAEADHLFPTYSDDSGMTEEGRYGIISLTSSPSSNMTLNLSGIVILGLTLSAAVCTWAYSLTFLEKTASGDLALLDNLIVKSKSFRTLLKLSPSTTSLNYTLNMSGLLALGLSVAAATMFWAHVSSLADNRLKRSVEDDGSSTLPIMLSDIQRRFDNASINDVPCRQRIICEVGAATRSKTTYPEGSFGNVVNVYFGSIDVSKMLKENAEIHKRTKAYLTAWSEGKRGKLCKIAYGQCSMNRDSIDNFIGSDNQ